jgi:hypothetical protein
VAKLIGQPVAARRANQKVSYTMSIVAMSGAKIVSTRARLMKASSHARNSVTSKAIASYTSCHAAGQAARQAA